ncbi:MAG: Fe3+/spermidine/putrescine ABC transporter ATP-binding protein [Acidobacteria bacterium]|nr:MAG: Fe3+/spermidine/putrescine ABC transporter ATP-binding protein [Acidobacteriota bacterium]
MNENLQVQIKKRLTDGKRTADDARAGFMLDLAFETRAGINILFGPSGSGKTTTLRAIAGLVAPDEGRIAHGAQIYFDSTMHINLPIQRRRVGFVFQDNALFPHLTAAQNVAYGVAARERTTRARALLAQFGVEHLAAHYPRELSGGEQQRVALARALAPAPAVLLLDEPLSAVDVPTRARLLDEIDAAQRTSGIPFLYVTHNHAEAVRLGTHLILLHEGRVVQTGRPLDVFNAPQSASAVRAVGTENLFAGRVVEQRPAEGVTVIETNGLQLEAAYNALSIGSLITLGVRAEDIIIARERLTQTSARNVIAGRIREIMQTAEQTELIVDCGVELKVSVTAGTIKALDLRREAEVFLLIKARALHVVS